MESYLIKPKGMRLGNNRYKLLLIDVDGTLVDKDGVISTENRVALAKAAARGVKVSLSTGRVIIACLPIIELLSLDGVHIFFDGALVSNPTGSEEIYARPLKTEVVKQAVNFARLNDIHLELYSRDHFFAEREHWSDEIHRRFFRVEPTFVDFSGIWERECIIKVELVVSTPEEKAKARSFQDEFVGSLRFSIARTPAYPSVEFINIIDPEVSKGKALKTLALHLGIQVSEVMAVGDGLNDISLLGTAGLAVAMGNATDEVKKVADHVTLDVDHSGLAVAIEKFLV